MLACMRLAVAFLAACSTAPTLDLQAELDAAVAHNGGRGGGILRVETRDGTLLWEGASGNASGTTPLEPGDAFEIQSVTKTFTAATALRLVEDGRLALDAPLASLIPSDAAGTLVIDGHDYGPELTIRQLLAHRAGLPDYWNDGPFGADGLNDFQRVYVADDQHVFTPDEVLAYARTLAPIDRPGATFHYTDTGYVLLGRAIEAAAGAPYHQVVRDEILTPLGLSHTYLTFHEPAQGPVSAWYDAGELVTGVPHQSADWAGGGLVSTAADLATFVRALDGDRLFHDPATLVAMQDFGPTGEVGIDYGFGLFRVDMSAYDEPDKGKWWGHDGYGNAFMYEVAPDVVVTGTLNNAQADFGAMVDQVQDVLLARK
jgi:D-alanyl-D-alanine carboxypeptidase